MQVLENRMTTLLNGHGEAKSAFSVSLVLISTIKCSSWNPPSRVEEKRLRGLKDSISDVGLLYPVLMDKNNNLIDGHRRLVAVKELGWKQMFRPSN